MSVDVRSNSGAAQRVADTLLRVMGGFSVALRVGNAPAPGDGGQVGLPGAQYSDLDLGTAVFRKVLPGQIATEGNTYELLISASDLEAAAEQSAAADVTAFLNSGLGIVVDGSVLQITSVGSAEAFGSAYLYRVELRDA